MVLAASSWELNRGRRPVRPFDTTLAFLDHTLAEQDRCLQVERLLESYRGPQSVITIYGACTGALAAK